MYAAAFLLANCTVIGFLVDALSSSENRDARDVVRVSSGGGGESRVVPGYMPAEAGGPCCHGNHRRKGV